MIKSFLFLPSLLPSFLPSSLSNIILEVGGWQRETGTGSCLFPASPPVCFPLPRNLPFLLFLEAQSPASLHCLQSHVLLADLRRLFLSYFPALHPDVPSLARSYLTAPLKWPTWFSMIAACGFVIITLCTIWNNLVNVFVWLSTCLVYQFISHT